MTPCSFRTLQPRSIQTGVWTWRFVSSSWPIRNKKKTISCLCWLGCFEQGATLADCRVMRSSCSLQLRSWPLSDSSWEMADPSSSNEFLQNQGEAILHLLEDVPMCLLSLDFSFQFLASVPFSDTIKKSMAMRRSPQLRYERTNTYSTDSVCQGKTSLNISLYTHFLSITN